MFFREYLRGKGHEKMQVVGPGWVENQQRWCARKLRVVGRPVVAKVEPFEDSDEDSEEKEARKERARERTGGVHAERREPRIGEPLVSADEMEVVKDEVVDGRKGEFNISADEMG